jgi:hypothetical protein
MNASDGSNPANTATEAAVRPRIARRRAAEERADTLTCIGAGAQGADCGLMFGVGSGCERASLLPNRCPVSVSGWAGQGGA